MFLPVLCGSQRERERERERGRTLGGVPGVCRQHTTKFHTANHAALYHRHGIQTCTFAVRHRGTDARCSMHRQSTSHICHRDGAGALPKDQEKYPYVKLEVDAVDTLRVARYISNSIAPYSKHQCSGCFLMVLADPIYGHIR